MRRGSRFVVAIGVAFAACGGDDDSDASATMPTSITAATDDTAGDDDDGASAGSSTGAADSSSGGAGSTGAGSTDDGADSTGGVAGDPSYPPPGVAGCPDGTADIQLPGATACAPFCDGAGAACPAPATGDATPECTPFAMPGGSRTPCDGDGDCTAPEACGAEGTCISVAFWGCRLLCAGGEACPDAMTCSPIGACGYGDL